MNVRELIEKLSRMPMDADVVACYEAIHVDIRAVTLIEPGPGNALVVELDVDAVSGYYVPRKP